MTAEPTVTVAVPVLDEEEHLAPCLKAVAAQTYRHIVEVLVVDGGSRDRTCEIAAGTAGVSLRPQPAPDPGGGAQHRP